MSAIKKCEPKIFFIVEYTKLRMLELYYVFFSLSKDLEIDTDSLYLVVAVEKLYEICICSKLANCNEK